MVGLLIVFLLLSVFFVKGRDKIWFVINSRYFFIIGETGYVFYFHFLKKKFGFIKNYPKLVEIQRCAEGTLFTSLSVHCICRCDSFRVIAGIDRVVPNRCRPSSTRCIFFSLKSFRAFDLRQS